MAQAAAIYLQIMSGLDGGWMEAGCWRARLCCGSKRCHKFVDATTPVKGDLPMTLEKSFGTLILLSRFRSFHAFSSPAIIGTVVSSSNTC
jgi:hypothetical protein